MLLMVIIDDGGDGFCDPDDDDSGGDDKNYVFDCHRDCDGDDSDSTIAILKNEDTIPPDNGAPLQQWDPYWTYFCGRAIKLRSPSLPFLRCLSRKSLAVCCSDICCSFLACERLSVGGGPFKQPRCLRRIVGFGYTHALP